MNGFRPTRLPMVILVLIAVLAPVGCGKKAAAPNGQGAPSPIPSATAPSASQPARPVPLPTTGIWRRIAAAPIPTGAFQAVWTGTQMLLHQPNYRTGLGSIDAAYNPAANTWRRLPASPYRVQSSEAGTQIAWDGRELLTFGVMNAALNPATGRWRPIKAPPLAGPSVVLWTGSQVLIWGGGCCGDATAEGAAYNPASNQWTALPHSPLAARHAAGVWTGIEMVIVGGQTPDGVAFADAAAYNPGTHSWRKLPPLPASRYASSLTWTGREVLVVGGEGGSASVPCADGYAYNPATNRWRRLPSMESGRTGHTAVWTGQHLIVWGGRTGRASENPAAPPHGLVLDPKTDRWGPLPKAPIRARKGPVGIWTGTDMLVWGGAGLPYPYPEYVDGATYRP